MKTHIQTILECCSLLAILLPPLFSGVISESLTDPDSFTSFLGSSILHQSGSKEPSVDIGVGRQYPLSSTQSFVQRRLFNTSVALTVPLFSFTLPQRANQGSTVDLANQAIFGLFALLVTVLVFAVPVLFTGVRPLGLTGRGDSGSGTEAILNNLMKSSPIFNLMGADLQHKIGLDSTKCLQKTICDAHRSPRNKQYGMLAVPFQIFFPPPSKDARSSTAFQLAAKEGKYSKVECGEKFRCFFDILDLAQYIVDWYKFNSEANSD